MGLTTHKLGWSSTCPDQYAMARKLERCSALGRVGLSALQIWLLSSCGPSGHLTSPELHDKHQWPVTTTLPDGPGHAVQNHSAPCSRTEEQSLCPLSLGLGRDPEPGSHE